MPKKKSYTKKQYKSKAAGSRKRKLVYKRKYKKARTDAKHGNSWYSMGRTAVKYGLPLLKGIKTISGYGDYHGVVSGNQIPKIQNTSSGCIVRHREYIGDLQSSQGFASQQFYINPGNPTLFPWLNVVANQFEEWVPRGMVFEFKTTSSDTVVNVTTGSPALGSVIMATDYNIYNPPFSSKQQMENYEFATSCKPSCSMIHTIENKRSSLPIDPYYVTNSPVIAGLAGDGRMYFPGVFQIATYGNTANANANLTNNLGEIWVSYEIELKKPRILPGSALNVNVPMDHFEITDGTASPGAPFGNVTTTLKAPTTGSTLGGLVSGGIVPASAQIPPLAIYNGSGQIIASSSDTYYFPATVASGNYMLVYNARFSGSGTIANSLNIVTQNCSSFLLINNNSAGDYITYSGLVTTVNCSFTAFVTVTSHLASVGFSVSGVTGQPNGLVFADFYVIQLPNDIN